MAAPIQNGCCYGLTVLAIVAVTQGDHLQGILHSFGCVPTDAGRGSVSTSRCSPEGIQIEGKRFSTSKLQHERGISSGSCFCFRGSAARIFAGWPIWQDFSTPIRLRPR